MVRLLKIELRKIIHNRIFWIAISGYILTMLVVLIGMRFQIVRFNDAISDGEASFIPLIPTEIYSFPHVWHNLTFIARFFKIFLAVIMVILVTNEYSYNTMRQNLINGLNRFQLVLSKFIDAILLSLLSITLIFIFGLISGFITTRSIEFADIFSKMSYLGAYFLMVLGFLSFTMMVAFLVKKPALVLGIVLLYIFIAEPIVSGIYSDSFGNYLPIKSMNLLVEIPDTALFSLFNLKPLYKGVSMIHVGLSIVYTSIFFGISYYFLKRKDL